MAIGRKNYLFAGSDAGGETLADALTLIETAKLSGLNPEAYLADVLARIHLLRHRNPRANHPETQKDRVTGDGYPRSIAVAVLSGRLPIIDSRDFLAAKHRADATTGAERIAAGRAGTLGVPQIAFKPDWARHRAPTP